MSKKLGVPIVRTKVSEMISEALERKGMSQRDLSAAIPCSYEHVRKVVIGESAPAPRLLRIICDELGLNYKQLEKIAVVDRIRKKFGKLPAELTGKIPELEPIEREWEKLSEEHKADIVAMVRAYAQRDMAVKKEHYNA